jgi:hypothetical protein
MVATSGVHRLASQICHNQLFRKKLQQNVLPMNSTEVSSLAAHNTRLVMPVLEGQNDKPAIDDLDEVMEKSDMHMAT